MNKILLPEEKRLILDSLMDSLRRERLDASARIQAKDIALKQYISDVAKEFNVSLDTHILNFDAMEFVERPPKPAEEKAG